MTSFMSRSVEIWRHTRSANGDDGLASSPPATTAEGPQRGAHGAHAPPKGAVGPGSPQQQDFGVRAGHAAGLLIVGRLTVAVIDQANGAVAQEVGDGEVDHRRARGETGQGRV